MLKWFERLSLISSLGSDAVMIYEALTMRNADLATQAFVDMVVHIGHVLRIKELTEERVAKYRASLAPIVADLLSDVTAK